MISFGPRVVGDYANEVLTPNMIEEEVHEAIFNAHSSQSILVQVSLCLRFMKIYLISNTSMRIIKCLAYLQIFRLLIENRFVYLKFRDKKEVGLII